MMHPSRYTTNLFLAASLALTVFIAESSVAMPQEQQPPANPVAPDVEPGEGDRRKGDMRRPPRGTEFGGGSRMRESAGSQRMMARRWRDPSPEDIQLFIEVAGELNPEWRSSLSKLQKEDAEGLKQAIADQGRRIWHLVELKERNEKLYKLRVEEIRTQEKLRALAREYRESVDAGPSAESERLHAELEQLALFQVDLQLRVRGEELAAMDEALKRLRTELMQQLEERQERARSLVERLIEPRPEGEQQDRPDRSRQWPGSPPRGGEGRGERPAPPVQGAS